MCVPGRPCQRHVNTTTEETGVSAVHVIHVTLAGRRRPSTQSNTRSILTSPVRREWSSITVAP